MDPYQILGISQTASDDEVKKAYRNLSRKYHPDANVNNPNKAQAEEKFKQVQQAYDEIMRRRQQGHYQGQNTSGQGYGGFYGFGGFQRDNYQGGSSSGGTQYQSPYENEIRAAVNYINAGHYQEAMHVLNTIPENMRTGLWNFYASIASNGLGDHMNARRYIQRAIELEPNNFQYRQFEQHLNSGATWYQARGGTYQSPYSGVGRWCLNMVLINALCNICCLGPRCI